MKEEFGQVYQFKISLKDTEPPIWRRIQVPENYTFWDLHVAIQDAMGWSDYHLHQFELTDPVTKKIVDIGIPDEELDESPMFPGWEYKIADWFPIHKSADYVYDFGDGWEHRVELEETLPREASATYPTCIGGKRACPPEDCGGSGGYEEFLEAINDPNHEEHEELLDWVGGEFDSEHFDPTEVGFDDPEERLDSAMESN
jgi:hypothetical protein